MKRYLPEKVGRRLSRIQPLPRTGRCSSNTLLFKHAAIALYTPSTSADALSCVLPACSRRPCLVPRMLNDALAAKMSQRLVDAYKL